MFLFSFALSGCFATVSIETDPDGDGVSDADEASLGLDPTSADSDGDGYDDGDEIEGGTDPNDAESRPFTPGDCAGEIEGDGTQIGDISTDWELTDQNDQNVALYDYCDKVVYMVFSAGWCGYCQQEAATLEEFYQANKDDGLMIIEMYTEDVDGNEPDQDDLNEWADEYGLTFPVVADPGSATLWSYVEEGATSVGLPYMVLLDRNLEVVANESFSHEDVTSLLEE